MRTFLSFSSFSRECSGRGAGRRSISWSIWRRSRTLCKRTNLIAYEKPPSFRRNRLSRRFPSSDIAPISCMSPRQLFERLVYRSSLGAMRNGGQRPMKPNSSSNLVSFAFPPSISSSSSPQPKKRTRTLSTTFSPNIRNIKPSTNHRSTPSHTFHPSRSIKRYSVRPTTSFRTMERNCLVSQRWIRDTKGRQPSSRSWIILPQPCWSTRCSLRRLRMRLPRTLLSPTPLLSCPGQLIFRRCCGLISDPCATDSRRLSFNDCGRRS